MPLEVGGDQKRGGLRVLIWFDADGVTVLPLYKTLIMELTSWYLTCEETLFKCKGPMSCSALSISSFVTYIYMYKRPPGPYCTTHPFCVCSCSTYVFFEIQVVFSHLHIFIDTCTYIYTGEKV